MTEILAVCAVVLLTFGLFLVVDWLLGPPPGGGGNGDCAC